MKLFIIALIQAVVEFLKAYNRKKDEDSGRLKEREETLQKIKERTNEANVIRLKPDLPDELLLPPDQRNK
jgi:hypothetical protein